jgi:probable addiction module antidote protein
MSKVEIRQFDPAEFITDDEVAAEYLTAALDTEDAAFIAEAIGTVARARGMAGIAEKTGLGRESLYKALSPKGNPELATVLKVMGALGVHLEARPAVVKRPPPRVAPVVAAHAMAKHRHVSRPTAKKVARHK